MKRQKKQFRPICIIVALAVMAVLFMGCPTPNNPPAGATSDYSGGVFKGPYAVSAEITVYELDNNLHQTGASYSGDIISNDGTYNIAAAPMTGYVELVANGYFFNEITGQLTNQPLSMRAITEQTGTVNITLFTAITTDRIRCLFGSGLTMEEAKTQALSELYTAFNFTATQENPEDVNVQTSDGAALIALSAAFAQDRSAAEIQELITVLRTDLADGVIDDISMLEETGKKVDAEEVRQNLQGYYDSKDINIGVPDFADELYGFCGAEQGIIEPDDGNRIKLIDGETVTFGQGQFAIDGFLIPEGVTMTWSVTVGNDVFRIYNTDNVTATADMQSATATGPCYATFDYGVLYAPAQSFPS